MIVTLFMEAEYQGYLNNHERTAHSVLFISYEIILAFNLGHKNPLLVIH